MAFILISRVAGETQGEYTKRRTQEQHELDERFPRATWKDEADGLSLISEFGDRLAYISFRDK